MSKGLHFGLSLLYICLNGFNLFINIYICFSTLPAYLSPHYFATAITIYLILRNLIYKLFRLLGFHALPELKSYGPASKSLSLPRFSKIDSTYLDLYRQRDWFLNSLFYFLFIIFHIGFVYLCATIILVLAVTDFSRHSWQFFLTIILGLISYLFLRSKFEKWFAKCFHAKVILIEHELPIFAKIKKHS